MHIKIEKMQLEKETKITVKTLNLAQRQEELALMISGKTVTEASLNAAKELLHRHTVACPRDNNREKL